MESDSDNSDHLSIINEDIDDQKHEKLIENVLNLNKAQHVKKPSRTEPTLKKSEYDLVKSVTGEKGTVDLLALTKALSKRKNKTHVEIGKKLQKATKEVSTIPKPLEKPQAERISRGIAYTKTKLNVDKWEPIVTSNRAATSLTFPLDHHPKLKIIEEREITKNWKIKSKLQDELEKIEPKIEVFHVNTEEKTTPMSLREMMETRKEMAKIRAIQSYKEAKARRVNKIKSKKYHRIQKREKIKQQLKEFEELQKTNPDEALKRLEEIDRIRIEERFKLRHRGTGKWARSKQIRAKYDKESRQALAEQLALSRELTQKREISSDSEDDETNETNTSATENTNPIPWQNGVTQESEFSEFLSKYNNYYNTKAAEKNVNDCETKDDSISQSIKNKKETDSAPEIKVTPKHKTKASKKKKTSRPVSEDKNLVLKDETEKLNPSSTSDWKIENIGNRDKTSIRDASEIEEVFDKIEQKLQKKAKNIVKKIKRDTQEAASPQKLKQKSEEEKITLELKTNKKKPIIDEPLLEDVAHNSDNSEQLEKKNDKETSTIDALRNLIKKEVETVAKLDKNSNMPPKPVKPVSLPSAFPDSLTGDFQDNDENENLKLNQEAFEDDDLIDEFNKEKAEETGKDKPKDIDLTLPGWGSWGGPNMKVNKRKRKRFLIRMPKTMPRRDQNRGRLIINEKANAKISEHMVKELPFPFKTAKDFEASIRAPIGNTFVPESAFRKFVKPAVITKLGTIIEPMSKDVLLNKK